MTAAALVCLAVIISCAAVNSPDGGRFDDTPPKFLGGSPAMLETEVTAKKLTLNFNEFIKVEGASEKVVVSPPQMEQPEIEVRGMNIKISLKDSLKPNTTYSIDFSDAVVDFTEGNPLDNFCYLFSTGTEVDTMEVSGYVLQANDLEPISGIMVGAYTDLSDTAFTTKPFEKVTRTGGDGRFVMRGLKRDTKYRFYALKDMDQDYHYSQRSEMIAWSDSIVIPNSETMYRDDTVWRADRSVDTIRLVPYTRFYPDNIVLRAFTPTPVIQYISKSERATHEKFTLEFALPLDSMPEIKGLNFNSDSAWICENTARFDTLVFWMRDSNVYWMDTLRFTLSYMATDTVGELTLTTDTLSLIPKKSRAQLLKEAATRAKAKSDELEKQRKKLEREGDTLGLKKLLEPPPPTFLKVEADASGSMDLNGTIGLKFPEPVIFNSDTAIHLLKKEDTLWLPVPFIVEPVEHKQLEYRILAEWRPKESYRLLVDSAAVTGLYGLHNKAINSEFTFKDLDQYSVFTVNVASARPTYRAELIGTSGKVERSAALVDGSCTFFFLRPGKYYLRMFDDRNLNGIWDTGEYETGSHPEEMFYMNKEFELKQNWDHETEPWQPGAEPPFKQKPEALIKQKSKTKERISKNIERDERIAREKAAKAKSKEKKKNGK